DVFDLLPDGQLAIDLGADADRGRLDEAGQPKILRGDRARSVYVRAAAGAGADDSALVGGVLARSVWRGNARTGVSARGDLGVGRRGLTLLCASQRPGRHAAKSRTNTVGRGQQESGIEPTSIHSS